MNKILKYRLKDDINELSIPEIHEVLSIQSQEGWPTLWALCDISSKEKKVKFAILGTGEPIPNNIQIKDYISTVQVGIFVWHIFKLNN
jgi:hypothetical protein